MSAAYQLVLLSSDLQRSEDLEAAVSAINYFSQMDMIKVVASLHTNAVEILKTARQRIRIPCRLDAIWNSCTLPISPQFLVPTSALDSTVASLQAELVPRDLQTESRDAFSRRLYSALFTPSDCSLVVLTPLSNIKICVELLGQQCEKAPVVSKWTVYTNENRAECQIWCMKFQELKYTAPVQQTFESSESLSELTPQSMSEFEQLFASQASPLYEQLISGLTPSLSTSCASPNSSGLHIMEVAHTVQSLQERYNRVKDSLNRGNSELAAFQDTQTTKLRTIWQELEEIQQTQTAIEREIEQITTRIVPAVNDLKANLATCEANLAAMSHQIATAQSKSSKNPFPLTIQSIFRNERNCPFAKIVSHKLYPVYGCLQVTQDGAEARFMQYEFPSLASVDVDLTSIAFQGKWQLTVFHFLGRTAISNSAEGEIWGVPLLDYQSDVGRTISLRRLDETKAYRVTQNFGDYEEIVRRKMGDDGVRFLHQLCKEWQNESESRVQEFLDTIADVNLVTEEEIRKRLINRGFQF